MKILLNKQFDKLSNLYSWYLVPGKIMNIRAWDILILILGVNIPIYYFSKNEENVFTIIGMVLFIIHLITLIYIGYLRTRGRSKIFRYVFKGEYTPLEALKLFNERSYIYGILWFNLVSSIFITLIILLVSAFLFDLRLPLERVFFNVFLISLSIVTYLWFTFHLSNGTAKVKEIKVIVNKYLAISATFLAILYYIPNIEIAFKPIITLLGVGYAWLRYITEALELEGYK